MAQYFGSSFGSANSSDLFYRMKQVPLLNMKNTSAGISNRHIPVMRSASTNYFNVASTTSIQLLNSVGSSLIATITSTVVFASSQFSAFYLDSTDQCLYVLLENNTQLQLAKINDTTGAVTTIGSPFTPANFTNWPRSATTQSWGWMEKNISGNIQVQNNGLIHVVDITTGAIISEDTPITVSDYPVSSINYISSDGLIVAGTSWGYPEGTSTLLETVLLPRVVSQLCGAKDLTLVYNTGFTLRPTASTARAIAIDDTHLCFMSEDSASVGHKIIKRTDWERFLESVVNFHAGLI